MIGIYVCYLFFFEGLMANPTGHAPLLQTLYTQHQKKSNTGDLPARYSLQLKYENSEKLTLQAPAFLIEHTALLDFFEPCFSSCQMVLAPVQHLRLTADAFKLYRRLQVFLI